MAAAGKQPAGKALPSLLPQVIGSMRDQVGFAQALSPQRTHLKAATPQFAWNIAAEMARDPAGVRARRVCALAELRATASTLEPQSASWRARLGVDHPSARMNLALIHFLCRHLDYPDRNLAKDLSCGMPLVGSVPATGVLRARLRPPRVGIDAWRASLPARNREIVARLVGTGATPMSKQCWGRTLEEARMGWVTTPVPVTDYVLGNVPLSPRFAKEEQHGAGARKIRVIDDLKASQINDLLGLAETSVPESLDVFTAMAMAHGHHSPQAQLKAFSVDFPHAYKQVGVAHSQLDFAMVVLCDRHGVPHVATLKTQPFGSSRAPANWARVTAFLQFVLRALFWIWLGVYVDDCYAVEPAELVDSAFVAVKELCEILGLSLSDGKEVPPRRSMQLLGAHVTLEAGRVLASLPERKLAEYRGVLLGALRQDRLSPAAAAKLRGRLGFAQSLLFGQFGRSMLNDLSVRQYARCLSRLSPLTDALRSTIEWWVKVLPTAPPRAVALKCLRPVLVYTDAQGAGHCAAVIFAPDGSVVKVAHTHVPARMQALVDCGIFELELTGVALGVTLALALYPTHPIVVCCDNQGAIGTIVRGTCKTALGRLVSGYIWKAIADHSAYLWVEFANSDFNVSDAPSRCCGIEKQVNEFTANAERCMPPKRFISAFSSLHALSACLETDSAPTPEEFYNWSCPTC